MDQMLEKLEYLTCTVMKSQVTEALQKLPSDNTMKAQGIGISGSVTRRDGKVCVVKWYDSKPVMMLSTVHVEEPLDTCWRWCKKETVALAYLTKCVTHVPRVQEGHKH